MVMNKEIDELFIKVANNLNWKTKKDIKELKDSENVYSDSFYKINYHKEYGGYRLEFVDKDGSVKDLHLRMPAKEFKAFLKGILFCCRYR